MEQGKGPEIARDGLSKVGKNRQAIDNHRKAKQGIWMFRIPFLAEALGAAGGGAISYRDIDWLRIDDEGTGYGQWLKIP